LEEALTEVDDGIPLKTVAKNHNILINTFKGHVFRNTLSRRRGKIGILTHEEESRIVTYLLNM